MDLRRDILSAGERNCDNIPFVSFELLRELVTAKTVEARLEARGIVPPPETIQTIVSKAPKLFAILVLTEQEHHIFYLLGNDINDDRFPMLEAEVPEFESLQQREKFYWTQWRFSLVLKKEKHLELPGVVPLPFTHEKAEGFGAFGVVSKVKISPGHLPEHKSYYAAMKTIRARRNYDWDTLMREVETLRRREHNNIVPLLASFTINAFGSEERSLRILFPWADMNMAQWLNLDSPPLEGRPRRDDQRNWLYHEIYALVSAISYLHRDIDGIITSHHDLKPENILWLEGSLKICDLGRSHLLTLAEGSETEGRSGLGTFTYQPPEYYNDDGSRSSRKHGRAFDVWSLGCIIVEMAILIVHGWDGHKVSEFTKARETGRSRRRDFSRVKDFDDSFHNNMGVVRQWISELKQGESLMLIQTLSIAEKMLAENPDERLYSWEAELDLYEMLYPDDHSISRMEKAGVCVQPPKMGNIGRAQNPLHRAILSGNEDRVVKLLESGWPIDARDGSGLTPIQLARSGGHTVIEHLLFSHQSHKAGYKPPPHETSQYITLLEYGQKAPSNAAEAAKAKAAAGIQQKAQGMIIGNLETNTAISSQHRKSGRVGKSERPDNIPLAKTAHRTEIVKKVLNTPSSVLANTQDQHTSFVPNAPTVNLPTLCDSPIKAKAVAEPSIPGHLASPTNQFKGGLGPSRNPDRSVHEDEDEDEVACGSASPGTSKPVHGRRQKSPWLM